VTSGGILNNSRSLGSTITSLGMTGVFVTSLGMTGVFVTSLGMTQKCLDEPKKETPGFSPGRRSLKVTSN